MKYIYIYLNNFNLYIFSLYPHRKIININYFSSKRDITIWFFARHCSHSRRGQNPIYAFHVGDAFGSVRDVLGILS